MSYDPNQPNEGASSDSSANGMSGQSTNPRLARRPKPSVGQAEDVMPDALKPLFAQSATDTNIGPPLAPPESSSVQTPDDFRSTGPVLNLNDNTPAPTVGDAGFDKAARRVMGVTGTPQSELNVTGTMTGRSLPSLAQQGSSHPLVRAITNYMGLTAPQPEAGQPYTGPITPVQKQSALQNFIQRATGAVAMGAARTPEEQAIVMKQAQFPQELAMQKRQLENEAAWRAATVGERSRHDVATEGTAQQRANTGETKVQAQIPLMGAQTDLAQAKAEKTQLETWQMQQGMFPVDAVTASLVNRPDLAGKAVPTALWKAFQNVLAAKGFHTQDLGNEGLWVIDRAGDRVHQISSTSPSVARAQAYGANRPVAVMDDQGNLRYMPAGQAYATGASPAGPGVQAGQKEAQFRDIQTGSASARQSILNLDSPLSASAIGELTMAMRETDPTVFHQLMDNFLGTQQLTPAQQDFAVAISQLNERALSLRSVAGMGQGSDQLRAAIRATLPSAKSGDRDLMLKQLNAFDQQVDALHTGVPGTAVNPKTPVHKAAGGSAPGAGGAKRKPNW